MDTAIIDAATEGMHTMVAEVLPPVPGRVLHVDGDFLAYWTGVIEDAGTARTVAANKITKAMELSRSERAVVHLTDEASSKADRRIIAETLPYQAHRSGSTKPINWAHMRTYLGGLTHGKVLMKNWTQREADDGMAYVAYLGDADLVVIMSKDKDMRMLPGWHMDWDDFSMTFVPRYAYDVVGANGKQYGLKWFWLQVLQGDKADNIPGLPKYIDESGKAKACGDKTAEKLLAHCKTSTEAGMCVAQHYELYYGEGWQRKLIEQMLLLWLRTDKDATITDIKQVLPLPNDDHLWYFGAKIKEAYAAAADAGASSPAPDDT
jgi:hypothetical protein